MTLLADRTSAFGGLGLTTAAQYEAMIQALQWDDLRSLWQKIKQRNTPEWDSGKAFEYLVIRAFQLDGAQVRYSYSVKFDEGQEVEQIDGARNRVSALTFASPPRFNLRNPVSGGCLV